MKTDPSSVDVDLIINRHYNKKELRFLFGDISLYYLNRMIDNTPEIGEPLGLGFSPAQILILVKRYGFEKKFIANQNKIH